MNVLKSYKLVLFFSIFALLALTAVGPCQDQGKKSAFGEVSPSAFNTTEEAKLDLLLQTYVDKDSLVNYTKWLDNPSDFQILKNIIEAMGKVDDSAMTVDQKKSFYINAYNTLTLDLILSNYSKTYDGNFLPKGRSIRNINNLDSAVWDKFKWLVAGKQKSLNDIENKILRPMGDARIHFSIVCASKGCPPLYNHAFTANTVNDTLNELALKFVNSGHSTLIDKEKRTITTSQILKWFNGDFVKTFGSVQSFFESYVQVIPAKDVALFNLQFSDYDWSLNEATAAADPTPSATPSPTPEPGSGTEKEMS